MGTSKSNNRPRFWSRQELLALIKAKQAYEKRIWNQKRGSMEHKWTYVSSCCKHNVERSPFQCMKRWEKLWYTFRKIKSRGMEESRLYWTMSVAERRENKLPGTFDREVYERLTMDGEMMEAPLMVVPISMRMIEPEKVFSEASDSGSSCEKQPGDNNKSEGSSSCEERKRKRTNEEVSLENKIIEVLEKNNRILKRVIEAQNLNFCLDQEQWKGKTNELLSQITKIVDALEKNIDKLYYTKTLDN